ncbi:cyclin-dependent kinase 2-interacting protein isoform X2 [Macrosteles quadrilineatus]|uniref:cyclin-dependent kinase 2-interacting protein isoform X2 n=1 Tax=Macrosteles quadrilineatus TaxID=74068 RepID=UPI0023E2E0E7|nr:cyclin-dependent kinase 2-interacting protein isoform X2 [Macrosteles quadrilineatus]
MSNLSDISTPLKLESKTTFSPVLVSESPVNKTPRRGNLTGNPRKIRDSAADLFNQIQEWNNLCINGSTILFKINAAKTNPQDNGQTSMQNIYPDGLQELCDQLEPIHHQMSVCVEKMMTTKSEVMGVVKLEVLKKTGDVPMFLTWPAQQFGETWTIITSAYKTELDLKTHIKENIAHTADEDQRLFFITAWVNQPYVSTSVDTAIEALLKETGHR